MALEARDIAFRYPGSKELIWKRASLVVQPGQRIGILAPSGFGKTTFLKLLAGYETPETGQVLLDGKPLKEYKGYCPVQMIWQHPEMVINPRLRLGDTLAEGQDIGRDIIEGLGIEEGWLSRFPAELSGGELQRFCIARALGERTRYVLADEISTMLDLITQSQIWSFLLKEIGRRGIGLLAVSHSSALLERVCTQVLDARTLEANG